MSKSLDGKVALVTGGGGGIGRETVKVLLEHGARVVVADLSEEAGRETVAYVNGGNDVLFVAADVSDLSSVQALVARTVERFGRLDIAHNNAGIELPATEIADISVEQFNRVINVNLTGVFVCMKVEIPQMLSQGGGSIVNTSSGLGEVGQAGYSPYVASKHAVIGLTKTGALEYSSRGIRVNALLPGVIKHAYGPTDRRRNAWLRENDRTGSSHRAARNVTGSRRGSRLARIGRFVVRHRNFAPCRRRLPRSVTARTTPSLGQHLATTSRDSARSDTAAANPDVPSPS